jgi:hypothetical protein
MYVSTTNCITQLPPTNRSILEKLGVLQLEKKPSTHIIRVFTRGRNIRSTTYRLYLYNIIKLIPRPLFYIALCAGIAQLV